MVVDLMREYRLFTMQYHIFHDFIYGLESLLQEYLMRSERRYVRVQISRPIYVCNLGRDDLIDDEIYSIQISLFVNAEDNFEEKKLRKELKAVLHEALYKTTFDLITLSHFKSASLNPKHWRALFG